MAIQVTYRFTRRLSMRIVKSGDVHVSAPIGMPKSLVEQFIDDHRDWIAKARQRTSERQQRQAAFFAQLPLGSRSQRSVAQQSLNTLIAPMVERHAQAMGLKPPSVTFRAMKSRWGVCHIQERSVCFSLYLLLLPEWCVEHVVVHELCHLLEPSHNAHFHSLMDRYFPQWRTARKATRKLCYQS